MTAADHRKAMRKLLESFTPRRRMWETFDAWTEATAYATAQRATGALRGRRMTWHDASERGV